MGERLFCVFICQTHWPTATMLAELDHGDSGDGTENRERRSEWRESVMNRIFNKRNKDSLVDSR